MMWAVVAGQIDIAKLLWARTSEPLRAALIASLFAQSKADTKEGVEKLQLEEHAYLYENWAIGIPTRKMRPLACTMC